MISNEAATEERKQTYTSEQIFEARVDVKTFSRQKR